MASFTYEYPRPALTVDIALVSEDMPRRILLIQRKHDPFAGSWALPGGFVDEGERLLEAARRELHEETGINAADLQQLQAFADPGRDPRGWTVTVVYLTRVDSAQIQPKAADDAAAAAWFEFDKLPKLAFDHDQVLAFLRAKTQR